MSPTPTLPGSQKDLFTPASPDVHAPGLGGTTSMDDPQERADGPSGAQKRWIRSNDFKILLDHFLAELKQARKAVADPLEPIEIMVQNRDMAQWLKMAIAEEGSISANLRFMLPYEWTWEQLRLRNPGLPRTLASDQSPLSLLIYGILMDAMGSRPSDERGPSYGNAGIAAEGSRTAVTSPSITGDPLDPILRTMDHLHGHARHRACMALAGQIASVLDAYQNYRPELLNTWESESLNPLDEDSILEFSDSNSAERWQRELWRRVMSMWRERGLAWSPRSTLLQSLLEEAAKGKIVRSRPLLVFNTGLLSMPLIRFLDLLPCTSTMDIYTLHPSISAVNGAQSILNPLCEAFASESAAQFDVLSSATSFAVIDLSAKHDLTKSQDEGSLLSRIQASVRTNSPLDGHTMDRITFSRSSGIRIHSCHSRFREIETLHEFLLERFAEDPSLRPDEIAVVSPDIEAYAPFVRGVFNASAAHPSGHVHQRWVNPSLGDQRQSLMNGVGQGEQNSQTNRLPSIPFRISSTRNTGVSDSERLLQLVLRLEQEELTPDLLGEFLAIEALRSSIGIGSSDVTLLSAWFRENHLFGEPSPDPEGRNALPRVFRDWDSFFDRFWTGYLWGVHRGTPVKDVLPFLDVGRGERAEMIARLQHVVQHLRLARRELRQMNTLSQWSDRLDALHTNLLGRPASAGAEEGVGELIVFLRQQQELTGHDTPVPFVIVRSLAERLQTTKGGQTNRFTDGVVFSTMVPVRSIPFKVICMLGLNESEFPRKNRKPDFDLMAHDLKPGERDRSREDRGLFLESLMACGSHFLCSYIGRNAKSNEKIPPSTVLHEWITSLSKITGLKPEELVVHHKINGSSPAYFTGADVDGLWSFHPTRFRIADRRSRALEGLRGFVINGALTDPTVAGPTATIASSSAHFGAGSNVVPTPGPTAPSSPGPTAPSSAGSSGGASAPYPSPSSAPLVLTPQHLITFFKAPVEVFLKERFTASIRTPSEEQEEFAVSYLDRHYLREHLLKMSLQGEHPEQILARLQSAGSVPSDEMGRLVLLNHTHSVLTNLDHLRRSYGEIRPRRRHVSVTLPGARIEGPLEDAVTPSGDLSIQLYLGAYSGKTIIEFWIRHLIGVLSDPTQTSLLVADFGKNEDKKGKKQFKIYPLLHHQADESPEDDLSDLIELYRKGMSHPLRFFPKTAAEYLGTKNKTKGVASQYLSEWSNKDSYRSPGESQSPSIRLLYGEDAPLDPSTDHPLFEQILSKPFHRLMEEKK